MSGLNGQKILITGGAGFIGSSIALTLVKNGAEVVVLDNLRRRGSELNLPRLNAAGVEFLHGDIRTQSDIESVGDFEVLLECSAEPSVLAGYASTKYVFDTNLVGAYNCLEVAAARDAFVVFLSTSRVYPIEPLNSLRLSETETRFEIESEQPISGAGPSGISEDFPLDGARTLYGTTKLSAEHLIAEYRESLGLKAVVNRCGVVAGPWQMGKVDQGVFTHWLLNHYFERPLSYIGYGGDGKQVRDLIHIADLVDLVVLQVQERDKWDGAVFNVGGGLEGSLSLQETTSLCREITGNEVPIRVDLENRRGDVPVYISDCSSLFAETPWRPSRTPRDVLSDTYAWISENEAAVRTALEATS